MEAEVKSYMKHMKTLAIDATLHTQAKLMEEYKVGEHSKCDLDYEIEVWVKREAELTAGSSVEEKEDEASPIKSEGLT